MWDCTPQTLLGGGVERFVPRQNGSAISYAEALRLWQNNESFRSFFMSLLAESRFSGYRWETPPITSASAGREFEFVLVDSPGLDGTPDRLAFADQFESLDVHRQVVVFPNLGKDAVLVVPRLVGVASAYAHLALFMRNAPSPQQHELWRTVGAAMQARLGSTPVWLSTAGMGVSWLHVRLDDRPKYYAFAEYRQVP